MSAPSIGWRSLRALFAAAVVLTSCTSSEPKGSTTATAKAKPVTETKQSYKLIPAKVGPFEKMWSELKNTPQVSLVTSGDDLEAVMQAAKEGKSANEVQAPRIASFDISTPSGKLNSWGVYTDSSLLKAGTALITQPTVDLLISAFHNPNIDAVSFNPYTKYSKEQVFSYTIEKLYIARLIGYLQSEPTLPGKTQQAAVESFEKENFFQTIYFGLLAYDRREQEPWHDAELAKVAAMDKLGFKAMAKSELDWFIDKFGPNPKADQLKQQLNS